MPVVPERHADNQHDENRRQPGHRINGDVQAVRGVGMKMPLVDQRGEIQTVPQQYLSISVGFILGDSLGFASRVAR